MENRDKFQKYIEKRLKLKEAREREFFIDTGDFRLKVVRTPALERRALFIFKDLVKGFKGEDAEAIKINLGFAFEPDTLEELATLLYDACPELKNQELHKELNIKIPERIVEELFSPIELINFGFEVVQFLAGLEEFNDIQAKKNEVKKLEKK